MNTAIKLGGFGIGLAAVFTAALGLGSLFPASAPATPAAHGGHTGTPAEQNTPAAALPAGLQISQDGYRLTLLNGSLSTGTPQPFRFQITGPDSRPVTAYTTSHDKDLHLIVVRRDLSGFQHVHPELGRDGTWSIPLAVPAAGQYRVFADFQPAGNDGLTLGADVPAVGDYRPTPLPATARTATVDGYTVTLTGDLAPGASSTVTLSVSKDGRPVTDLQPYLGAYGHLVALRDGDLAYLHVHPDGTPGDGRTTAGPAIAFHAEVPSAGAYRLYLDFQHGGKVRTAEFTAVAGSTAAPMSGTPATAAASTTPSPARHGADGHTHD
ncbi:hypothetical protein [Actinoplanes teichomyceticus]|uniref:Secreted protein n=1 Tax=Actinoplanes teichomyceticus TaxID=1867 RepID=A0A561WMG9_ACTTI|nr:hypothetical protein [Actinoplanes teichomyceticus]TWG25070.1 hypothetical protein FHX34_10130 [Actinoplanes teichomyceticus]GIF10142.1 hypothetical protein Ate01nite_01740 [Actinoplanes teichomyceticus]